MAIASEVLHAQYIHNADFESGDYMQSNCADPPCIKPCGDINKDTGCDCAEGTSIKVVSKDSGAPVRAGNYSSMHRLADCHERTEFYRGWGL